MKQGIKQMVRKGELSIEEGREALVKRIHEDNRASTWEEALELAKETGTWGWLKRKENGDEEG